MRLDCDNQSAIFLVKNLAYHFKTNHIDVQYYVVRDMVESKKVMLEKVDTLENIVGSLKKIMSIEKLAWCRVAMNIYALDFRYDKHLVPLVCKQNNRWKNVGYVLYSLHVDLPLFDRGLRDGLQMKGV